MATKKKWLVVGAATVTVYVTVLAESAEEAKKKAHELPSRSWEVDEVDGEVVVHEAEVRS